MQTVNYFVRTSTVIILPHLNVKDITRRTGVLGRKSRRRILTWRHAEYVLCLCWWSYGNNMVTPLFCCVVGGSFEKRLADRVEEYSDVVLHHGKNVSEAFTTMACDCGQLNRGLGASKVFTCADPKSARHEPGVAFDRDRHAARNIAVLNSFRVYKPVRATQVPAALVLPVVEDLTPQLHVVEDNGLLSPVATL